MSGLVALLAAAGAIATRQAHSSRAANPGELAFYSLRGGDLEIYRMRSDGRGQRALTANDRVDARPVWSPDGGRLASTPSAAATSTCT